MTNPPATVVCDIAIVGGGMTGTALALLLARHAPQLRVTLVEKFPIVTATPDALSQPSFDARSTALSAGSRSILETIGVWHDLHTQACPILKIHVSDRGKPGGTVMDAAEEKLPALGYVAENRHIGSALLGKLLATASINTISPATVTGFRLHTTPDMDAAGIALHIETAAGEQVLQAQLMVIADGAGSALRQQLGIEVEKAPYDQRALITNIVTSEWHQHVAYERFTDQGPVAMLPLPDCAGKHRSALVWTLPEQDADAVLTLPDAAFLQHLQARFGYRLGELLAVGERSTYPLALIRAKEQVRSHVVLMGNAAHALHPVAGQGFNLALRDCEALAQVVGAASNNGKQPGDIAVLEHYQQLRLTDQERIVTASDQLPRLFASSAESSIVARNLGLLGLGFLPGTKHWFVRQAAGVSGVNHG